MNCGCECVFVCKTVLVCVCVSVCPQTAWNISIVKLISTLKIKLSRFKNGNTTEDLKQIRFKNNFIFKNEIIVFVQTLCGPWADLVRTLCAWGQLCIYVYMNCVGVCLYVRLFLCVCVCVCVCMSANCLRPIHCKTIFVFENKNITIE